MLFFHWVSPNILIFWGWPHFQINDKLKELPHTTAQMLQEVLTRLEEEHGVALSSALSSLACVRDGKLESSKITIN